MSNTNSTVSFTKSTMTKEEKKKEIHPTANSINYRSMSREVQDLQCQTQNNDYVLSNLNVLTTLTYDKCQICY